jgi:diacylglycerol kinase family enzyme
MIKMTKNRINDLEIENVYLKSELLDRPSLRDQFAMAALTGIITRCATYFDENGFNQFAIWSYEIADAMLAARNEPTKN